MGVPLLRCQHLASLSLRALKEIFRLLCLSLLLPFMLVFSADGQIQPCRFKSLLENFSLMVSNFTANLLCTANRVRFQIHQLALISSWQYLISVH
jgi:hypothetical protein